MLSKEAIEEFQAIYLKTYGKEISFSEAEVQAAKLLRLYKIVFRAPASPQETRTPQS